MPETFTIQGKVTEMYEDKVLRVTDNKKREYMYDGKNLYRLKLLKGKRKETDSEMSKM